MDLLITIINIDTISKTMKYTWNLSVELWDFFTKLSNFIKASQLNVHLILENTDMY